MKLSPSSGRTFFTCLISSSSVANGDGVSPVATLTSSPRADSTKVKWVESLIRVKPSNNHNIGYEEQLGMVSGYEERLVVMRNN